MMRRRRRIRKRGEMVRRRDLRKLRNRHERVNELMDELKHHAEILAQRDKEIAVLHEELNKQNLLIERYQKMEHENDTFFTLYCGTEVPDLFDDADQLTENRSSFRQYIASLIHQCSAKNKQSRVGHVVQSSGYGKTRACFEVCRDVRAVYLSCADASCGIQASPLIMSLLLQLERARLNGEDEHMIVAEFLCAVYEQFGHLESQQICDQMFCANSRFKHLYLKKITRGFLSSSVIGKQDTLSLNTAKPNQDKSDKKNVTFVKQDWLVIFFDEAEGLYGTDQNDCNSPYWMIRHVIDHMRSMLTHGDEIQPIIAIFLSTSPPIPTHNPAIMSDTAFDRVQNHFLVNIRECASGTEHFLLFGRPLWYMQWKHKLNQNYTCLVELAVNKLLGNNGDYVKYALFVSRFRVKASNILAKELVSHHLATLLSISGDNDVCLCAYPSEPLLAEAAAYISAFYHEYSLKPLLEFMSNSFENSANSMFELPCNDTGDVAAAAAFTYTMDLIRYKRIGARGKYNVTEERYFSCDVSAFEFLCAINSELANSTAYDDRSQYACDLKSKLEGYSVNFTSFIRIPQMITDTFCIKSRDHHFAYYAPRGLETVDLIIVAYKGKACDDSLSYVPIRIQVKNYQGTVSSATLLSTLNKQWLQPVVMSESPPDVSVSISLSIGKGGVHQTTESNTPSTHQYFTRSRTELSHYESGTDFAMTLDINCETVFPQLQEAQCIPLIQKLAGTGQDDIVSSHYLGRSLASYLQRA